MKAKNLEWRRLDNSAKIFPISAGKKYSTVFRFSVLLKEELRIYRKADYTIEDSYMKNYDKKAKGNSSTKKAYKLKGKKLHLGAVSSIHEIIDLEGLKLETKKHNCTITQYLTAVLIYCIYQANFLRTKEKKNKENKQKKSSVQHVHLKMILFLHLHQY